MSHRRTCVDVASAAQGGKAFDVSQRGDAARLTDMRSRGEDDLDITFVGMGIVLARAVRLIQEALALIETIELPDCMWLAMPWKVSPSFCSVLCVGWFARLSMACV